MKSIIFEVHLQGNAESFLYMMDYRGKPFAVYFNDITLLTNLSLQGSKYILWSARNLSFIYRVKQKNLAAEEN